MSLRTLSELAQRTSLPAFLQAVDRFFLFRQLGSEGPASASLQFDTVTSQTAGPARWTWDSTDVRPIRKAPGNPYPERISLGRAPNRDIVFRDKSVSKIHAHFCLRDDTPLEIVDMGSQNGTRVNDVRLEPKVPRVLRSEDVLVFGSVITMVVDAQALYELLRGTLAPSRA